MMILAVRRIAALTLFSLLLAACGSSGGSSTPPAPPAPVAPPAPPPEPTFEERLADLAAYDPNSCRASTSGFEALGGWLKNDGRELGASQVWMDDVGQLSDPDSHGASVWATFTACAVRSLEAHYFENADRFNAAIQEDGGDAIQSKSSGLFWEDVPFPEPGRLRPIRDGNSDGQRILYVQGAGNESGKRTAALQAAPFQRALVESDTALWVIVGGYTGEGDNRAPAAQSSICGAADPLCLFAPWSYNGRSGTSHATPQVAAALDTVWAVWPDMDVLDLRNLAFDCADNMPAPAGEESMVREYSYLNGRGFTSATNSRWGHGILSLTCLFTPNGGLQDPTTGNAISGGIYGPLAGPITGASIAGVDYTGRDFGYGFARPVARENWALSATANLSAVQAISGVNALGRGPGAFRGTLWAAGRTRVELTAAGDALGAAAQWQSGRLTLRAGLAVQPEGVGSLTGLRAFRAPASVSGALTVAYGRHLAVGLSAHIQADTGGRWPRTAVRCGKARSSASRGSPRRWSSA